MTRAGASTRACALWATLLLAAAAVPAAGQKKGDVPHALVSGTVFSENGMVLRRADVVLRPAPDAPKEVRKLKKTRYTTDSRGEFAIRVPAVPAVYTLVVSAEGFESQEKEISVQGVDDINVFIRLQPASK
ncbi:MAG: carboxypeptidase regulatory-like domain-containing protein [bacterium]